MEDDCWRVKNWGHRIFLNPECAGFAQRDRYHIQAGDNDPLSPFCFEAKNSLSYRAPSLRSGLQKEL